MADTPVLWNGANLCLNVGRQIIFDHASFSIHSNERLALIGRNGSGKSTLLRVITGELELSDAQIGKSRDLRIATLPQECDFSAGMTVAQVIRSGASWLLELLREYETLPATSGRRNELEHLLMVHDAWSLDARLDDFMSQLGLSALADASWEKLSGGELRRTALARALAAMPDLLLLDEPTNHLDVETIQWIEDFLAAYRGTCLFVTHDRMFLDRIATRIVELDHGKFYSCEGSYADFLAEKAEREYAEDKQEEKRRSFLRREIDWVRRSPKARLKRNLGRLKRYDEVAAQSGPVRDRDMELVIPEPGRLGNKVLELKGLGISFDDRTLFEPFSYEFASGQKIGIVGPNGVGKTSLLKVLTGSLEPSTGSVEIAPTVEFNYIDQSKVVLDREKTVYDEISEGVDSISLGREKISIWGYLRRFMFEDERINTQIKYLSGGEIARLTLAKMLKKGGNFLILDEPTNDLDLPGLRILEEALASFAGCVLLVTHDRYFLNRVCNGIWVFEKNAITAAPGDYDYYLSKRTVVSSAAPAASVPGKSAVTSGKSVPKAPPKKLSYNEQRELDGMEDAIAAAEEAVAALEELFASPDYFAMYGDKTAQLTLELAEKKKYCEQLYARWDELEAKRALLEKNGRN